MTNNRTDLWHEDETRMTAALPNLEIEIRHRNEGEAGEVVTLQMRAHPDAESVLKMLLPTLPFAMGAVNPLLVGNPFALWMRMAALPWQPWLHLLPRSEDNRET